MLLTQSAWATDPTLTEEFKAEWQAAQHMLTGKWNQIMVYDYCPESPNPDDKYWRVCELIIYEDEESRETGLIKRGKYVEHNGDTTQITGGQLVNGDGVAITGTLKTKKGATYCVECGAIIELTNGQKRMVLGLHPGPCDGFVLEDFELEVQMLTMPDLNAKSVRNFLARHRVSEERAFPNMTVDQP
jgi:hypothetical protein